MLTKRIVLINCYFGKLPNYFPLFIQSCKYNTNIDFLFFSDQYVDDLPQNVKFLYFSFEDFRKYIENCFPFEICLKNPYKLCDYKPAYGYIFKDFLKSYDFWGHIDVDLILGKIDHFLNDEILESYEKIYQLGHMCLYKNTEEVNALFMSQMGMNYKNVFQTDVICVFDEMIGMQDKFNKLGRKTYKSRDMLDINPKHYKMDRVNSWLSEEQKKNNNFEYQTFYWDNGSVYRAGVREDAIVTEEYIYIHFPKRKMPFNCDEFSDNRRFFITNRGFDFAEKKLTKEEIKSLTNNNIILDVKYVLNFYFRKWMTRLFKYFFHKAA